MARGALIGARARSSRAAPARAPAAQLRANPKQFSDLRRPVAAQKTFERLSMVAAGSRIFVSTNDAYATQSSRAAPALPRRTSSPSRAPQHSARRSRLLRRDRASESRRRRSRSFRPTMPSATSRRSSRRRPARTTLPAADDVLVDDRHRADGAEHRIRISRDRRSVATGVVAWRDSSRNRRASARESFSHAGRYAWNGGMFVWRYEVFRRALQNVRSGNPALAERLATRPAARRAARCTSRCRRSRSTTR